MRDDVERLEEKLTEPTEQAMLVNLLLDCPCLSLVKGTLQHILDDSISQTSVKWMGKNQMLFMQKLHL